MQALFIERLTKIYRNGTVALKEIDFSVEEGDFFALLGPNGAGKSTTIGIITSLINKSSGTVKVFDYDIDTHLAQAKSCIGVVPQEFNFNIFEKVIQVVANQGGYYGLPRRVALARAEEYLTKLGLWEKHDQTARSLSGGMKRRLMIARALVHKPKLLILDEPTAGVDIELRRSLWDFVREINQQGTTVILTTHYLEEAENLCRNIAIINQGKLIENTNMQTLLQKLQTETFILYLRCELKQAPTLQGFTCRLVEPLILEVDIQQGQSLTDLIQELIAQRIEVMRMRNKVNRLEELFVRLTSGKDI